MRLVCDSGRLHTTQAVLALPKVNKDKLEIHEFQPYCPELSLIESLWSHLKRPALAILLHDLVSILRWESAAPR